MARLPDAQRAVLDELHDAIDSGDRARLAEAAAAVGAIAEGLPRIERLQTAFVLNAALAATQVAGGLRLEKEPSP